MSLTCSFVVYTHNRRVGNLIQTIQFLMRNDPEILQTSEIVVVCQNHVEVDYSKITKNMRIHNLNMSYFSKAKMVNKGLEFCSSNVLAMIDGDRILPENYFKNAVKELKPNEIITTIPLYKLNRPFNNEEIIAGVALKDLVEDFRDPANVPGKKNAFSGNTVMYKDDFLRMGGMDESYSNYSCADLDFTMTVLNKGMKITYLNLPEYHLYHDVDMKDDEFKLVNCRSVIKFCRKWNRTIPQYFLDMIKDKKHCKYML